MNQLLVAAVTLALLVGCLPKPAEPECIAFDAGPDAGPLSPLDVACAGKEDGARCCLGPSPGRCRSGECAAERDAGTP